MNLREARKLRGLNELDMLYLIIDRVRRMEKDTENVLKSNRAAGIKVRKELADIILLSQIIRDKIRERRGKKYKRGLLEAKIANEEKKAKTDKEIFVKKIQKAKEKRDKWLKEKNEREKGS